MSWTPLAHIAFGEVVHARARPARHQFQYGTYFLLLPMRTRRTVPAPTAWQPNRAGPLSFRDEDHGAGAPAAQGGVLPWLLALLQSQGVADTGGEIWLQTYPRVWGYSFKPVSFWYCFEDGPDSALHAVVVEVNNTFGERHCYVLPAPRWGETVEADKVFHVSPFCEVQGHYAFCFSREWQHGRPTLGARVDYHDAQGLLLHTRITGALQPLDARAHRRALWTYPLMTLGVFWHIHRQAFALWRKRVPFFSKPEPPALAATRSRPT
jgi:hypothetical protein